jgi:multidrug efflux system membrane fusion protein
VVITALQPIAVVFTLPQQALPQVAAAMRKGEATVVAQGQASGLNGTVPELDRGRLTVLDNQVDPTTGTIKLKALFPNAQRTLWPGGFVNIRLLVDTLAGVLAVPPAAIQRGPRGSFVYTITPENTVLRRPVTVEYEDQATSVVTSGLNPGDRVVTDGAGRLNDNMKVTIVTPEEPRAGPTPAAPPGTRRRPPRGG